MSSYGRDAQRITSANPASLIRSYAGRDSATIPADKSPLFLNKADRAAVY